MGGASLPLPRRPFAPSRPLSSGCCPPLPSAVVILATAPASLSLGLPPPRPEPRRGSGPASARRCRCTLLRGRFSCSLGCRPPPCKQTSCVSRRRRPCSPLGSLHRRLSRVGGLGRRLPGVGDVSPSSALRCAPWRRSIPAIGFLLLGLSRGGLGFAPPLPPSSVLPSLGSRRLWGSRGFVSLGVPASSGG